LLGEPSERKKIIEQYKSNDPIKGVSNFRYCNYARATILREKERKDGKIEKANKFEKKITEKFGGLNEFEEFCMNMRGEDCANYNPVKNEKGVMNFLKKSLKYGLFVAKSSLCIYNILKAGGKNKDDPNSKEDKDIKGLADSVFSGWTLTKVIFKQIGSTILHLLTGGIWGLIKHIWAIIKLTITLVLGVLKFKDNLPYNLGKVVGLAIVAIKSLFIGRRR